MSRSPLDAGAIIWMIVIQIVACGIGGYLAGRLRTKWAAIHTDEVYFRDTAHGFLVWAVAVVMTAAFLGSAATAMVGGVGANTVAENAYLEGRLLRPALAADAAPGATEPSGSPADVSVARVAEQERQAAEEARKETGRFLLWTFVALLCGAFCASYAATIGGRQRDHLKAI
jgi:MFS family permease